MNIHLLGPTQTCSCDARHVCQSCQGQDDVNAKLLAALEASAIERHKDAYPIDNFHALAFEDCRESRCVQARAAIEEAKK